MKKLEMIIRPEKLEDLKEMLDKMGIKGMTVSTVMGCGHQRGIREMYRGAELSINLLHKVKVETVVVDDIVDTIIKKVRETVSTGNVGDGKIFIYNVEEAIRIRTGETGNEVL
jgi:nitrogen regulatory protein P-II 1